MLQPAIPPPLRCPHAVLVNRHGFPTACFHQLPQTQPATASLNLSPHEGSASQKPELGGGGGCDAAIKGSTTGSWQIRGNDSAPLHTVNIMRGITWYLNRSQSGKSALSGFNVIYKIILKCMSLLLYEAWGC